jgi:hypothetical protein
VTRHWLPLALLASVVPAVGAGQKPADPTPASKENIEAALRLTLAAAAEYEFRVGNDEKPLALKREPILQWSNPDRGEIHGNVFVWARDGRPLVVGSLFKWFSPFTHMSHEFQSFAEAPLVAKFHGQPVWKAAEAGVKFTPVRGAPAVAAAEAQRVLQLKQLARDFAAAKTERDEGTVTELRLLPQPVLAYSSPKQTVLSGGLFAFVHGTDPELFVLIEARGEKPEGAGWQYAATRMTSSALRLRHKGKEVWSAEVLPWKAVTGHELPYTSFMFKEVPDFLKDALAKPKR